jgi:hypothetical protein
LPSVGSSCGPTLTNSVIARQIEAVSAAAYRAVVDDGGSDRLSPLRVSFSSVGLEAPLLRA